MGHRLRNSRRRAINDSRARIGGDLGAGPPLVFAAIKETLRESEGMPFHRALKKINAREFPTVAKLYSSDDQLEARAFAEKRDPIWKGR